MSQWIETIKDVPVKSPIQQRQTGLPRERNIRSQGEENGYSVARVVVTPQQKDKQRTNLAFNRICFTG